MNPIKEKLLVIVNSDHEDKLLSSMLERFFDKCFIKTICSEEDLDFLETIKPDVFIVSNLADSLKLYDIIPSTFGGNILDFAKEILAIPLIIICKKDDYGSKKGTINQKGAFPLTTPFTTSELLSTIEKALSPQRS